MGCGRQPALWRVFAIRYDAAGDRTSVAYPNRTTTTYSFDARSRLTRIDTVGADGGTLQSYAYALDAAGRRTTVTETDGTLRSFGYDAVDRLTRETVTGGLSYAKTFTYDPVGNRTTQTTTGTGAGTVTYAYDARDRLTAENATAYAYDGNGNLTSKAGEATYSWDFENRLTRATMAGGAAVSHTYDPDGHRVQTSVSSGGVAATTNMLVDTVGCAACGHGLSQVVAETDGAGALTAYYVRVGDELLEVMRPAPGGTWSTRFVHHDGLGSVRALTDENGTTTDMRAYEAFGTKNVEAGSDPLPYGFAGEPLESTSKLAYHRARWMDGRTGRFTGADPVDGNDDQPLTWHRYVYAGDNPVTATDPTGQFFIVPSNFLWGIKVHNEIGADFLNLYGTCGEANRWINTIIGGGSNLRPDLVNICTNQVYEIKPFTSFSAGVLQLMAYIALMHAADPTISWVPGYDYVPPTAVVIVPLLTYAIVDPPQAGVITYAVLDLTPVVALAAMARSANTTVSEADTFTAGITGMMGGGALAF